MKAPKINLQQSDFCAKIIAFLGLGHRCHVPGRHPEALGAIVVAAGPVELLQPGRDAFFGKRLAFGGLVPYRFPGDITSSLKVRATGARLKYWIQYKATR